VRKLIVSMNVTLDGFMSGPDCELDWHFKCWNSEMEDELCKQLLKADTILLGRITYDAMSKYWPSKLADPLCRGAGFAFANMMNCCTKIVFSKTITSTEWSNSKLVTGKLEDEINALKAMPGKNIMLYGSGQLTDALIKLEMVDEYQLWLHPVILRKGKPLFKPDTSKEPDRLNCTLLSTERFSSGVILLHYQTNKLNENENSKSKTKRRILKR
jgi:dihydrofolate reductase